MSKFHTKSVKRKTILQQVGSISSEFYFIVKGGLRVYFLTNQGKEKTRHISLENSIIVALSSFIQQKPSLDIIESLEDTELLVINHTDFYNLVKTNVKWAEFYKIVLETAYINQTKHLEIGLTHSASERFEEIITNNPHYINRLSNKILASYLDISQETLSRLKSKVY